MKYIIDPYLFSFGEDMSEENLEQYIQTISDLDKWWKNHKEEMYVLSDMGDLLYKHEIYPIAEKLGPILLKYNSNFEYKDISRMLNRYLDRTNLIDEVCKAEYIEKTSEIIRTNIIEDIKERPQDFKDALKKLMWFVFCLHIIDNNELDSYVVFSKSLNKEICVEYGYDSIDTDKDSTQIISKSSNAIIYCHSSLKSFQSNKNTPFLMWRYAQNKIDLDHGLRCKVLQEIGLTDIDDIDRSFHFVLQDSFYKDFCNNKYASRSSDIKSALDSMLKVVLNVRHGKEHNMRTGKGGNDPYLFHGDYIGMRKNVTTSIKLHYWKREPYYQFANIGEHDFYALTWEDC
jgi:hypothetical protein